jgi:hypothetical protein
MGRGKNRKPLIHGLISRSKPVVDRTYPPEKMSEAYKVWQREARKETRSLMWRTMIRFEAAEAVIESIGGRSLFPTLPDNQWVMNQSR